MANFLAASNLLKFTLEKINSAKVTGSLLPAFFLSAAGSYLTALFLTLFNVSINKSPPPNLPLIILLIIPLGLNALSISFCTFLFSLYSLLVVISLGTKLFI